LSVVLQDTEDLCREMLESMDNLPVDVLGVEKVSGFKTRLVGIQTSVSQSKKKVMVRTEQGNKLSLKVKSVALELAAALNELTKSPSVAVAKQLSEPFLLRINQLEREARKIELYWKSYEAAIT
jgi:hypothetical protein